MAPIYLAWQQGCWGLASCCHIWLVIVNMVIWWPFSCLTRFFYVLWHPHTVWCSFHGRLARLHNSLSLCIANAVKLISQGKWLISSAWLLRLQVHITHPSTRTHTHAHTHSLTLTHTHTHTHTHSRTHSHTHTHAHMHTHTVRTSRCPTSLLQQIQQFISISQEQLTGINYTCTKLQLPCRICGSINTVCTLQGV